MEVETAVPAQRAASGVLADRMAAALVHREPGWQLPRRSALARRYNVSMAEIDAAIGELTRRSLIRRLPDGQLYRASAGRVPDPARGHRRAQHQARPHGRRDQLHRQARVAARRAAGRGLVARRRRRQPGPHHPVRLGGRAPSPSPSPPPTCPGRARRRRAPRAGRVRGDPAARRRSRARIGAVRARAVDLELAPPQPSVARSLRLLPGQPAISVTIRFDDRDREHRSA